jgi:hypothetical protein
MAEIIYTRVNPYEFIGQQIDLVKSIKQDGIKYPVLAHSNNRILNQSTFDYGNQRMLIALSLGLDEVPAILYSVHQKTGFDGEQINELDDIIRIFGKDIKNEPVWDGIRGALRKLPYPRINNSSSIG